MALSQASAERDGSRGAPAGTDQAGCGPTVDEPRSFLSALKAGFFSLTQTGLETALLAGCRVARGIRQRYTARMVSNRRDAVRVICCYRGALIAAGHMGRDSVSAPLRSFVNRSGWREFQTVLAGLRRDCPPALPVVVRASWLPKTVLGQCLRRDKRFVVLLNEEMGEPQAVEVLCHEWAHALAWNFAVDRLINAPDTDPVEFERACHDEAWGCAYSRVWRVYATLNQAG